MAKIKIGIVTPTFPPKGGGIATTHFNIYQLLKDDYAVRVFAYNDDSLDNYDSNVIHRKSNKIIANLLKNLVRIYLKKYDKTGQFKLVPRIMETAHGVYKLNAHIKKFNPDFLIVPDNYIPLYWLRKRNASKIIWFSHNNYRRFRDNPLIKPSSWIDNDVACSMERRAIRKADIVISPSKYMLDIFYDSYKINIPQFVIPNFIKIDLDSIQSIDIRDIIKIESRLPVVYIPSVNEENKGNRYVIEIMRRMYHELNGEVGFYLSGGLTSEMKFELDNLKIIIPYYSPGVTSWIQNLAFIKSCNLCLSPTLIENFSNAFVEAFSLSKPIVTFDVGGNKEIVDDGLNGYIVPYLDVDQLVNKACSLLRDVERLKSFSQEAKRKAQEFSDIERLKLQYSLLFNKVLNNK